MKKDYESTFNSDGVSVGYLPGSDKVLFIKTGQGGSIYGYENKYLDLAHEVNEKHGFTVFVSATSSDSRESYNLDIAMLDSFFVNKSYQIHYIGVSKGGLIGIWHGVENDKIKKIMAINAPLMINYHSKTRPAIEGLKDKLVMVYGSLDPSFKYVPFLPKDTRIEILDGADHNLVGSKSSFGDLVDKFLI